MRDQPGSRSTRLPLRTKRRARIDSDTRRPASRSATNAHTKVSHAKEDMPRPLGATGCSWRADRADATGVRSSGTAAAGLTSLDSGGNTGTRMCGTRDDRLTASTERMHASHNACRAAPDWRRSRYETAHETATTLAVSIAGRQLSSDRSVMGLTSPAFW